MTGEEVRQLLRARPFLPFLIRTADGRSIPVANCERGMVSPAGRTVIVYEADDSPHIVEVALVTSLEIEPDPPSIINGEGG